MKEICYLCGARYFRPSELFCAYRPESKVTISHWYGICESCITSNPTIQDKFQSLHETEDIDFHAEMIRLIESLKKVV